MLNEFLCSFSYVPPFMVKQVWFSAEFSLGVLTRFLLLNYLDNREGTLSGKISGTVSPLRATSCDFQQLSTFHIKGNFLVILRTISYYFLYSSRKLSLCSADCKRLFLVNNTFVSLLFLIKRKEMCISDAHAPYLSFWQAFINFAPSSKPLEDTLAT
jgi:hypothetical protein